ncbi:PD-(D/E)XK nuclease family protein [Sulfurimonas sp. SAG-AH-194-I05]|nr:PD-(D/E)XK nuclease family protein [Sulfurimonas sp. SAG-AH-194-I05]MDF1874149.1 PD-(D/E)XK nuclease family protein [Sulfurimonas sp. SAG-AH-194-I05]
MDNTTIVLPSARAIRHEQLHIKEETLFLPNFLTMHEFIAKLCIVKEYKLLDEDTRVLLLLEASDFQAFSSLQIQRNFFTFTKNSSYIFKFFEELSAEMYDIARLDTSDIYAEFEEHIIILQELYKRYELLCMEKKVLDRIFLPKLYTFNESYASSHEEIFIHVDGHLTNFELELLTQCCAFSSVTLLFTTSKFNTKMQEKLGEIGFVLEKDCIYKLCLNSKKILSQNKREKNTSISCESFSESLLQVSFIKQKLYAFVKKGFKAENIAVILPDEKMAETLKSFDDKSNFNFAMGTSFTLSEMYKKLHSTCQALDQDSKENYARLERIGDDLYVKLLSMYHQNNEAIDVLVFLKEYKEAFSSKREVKIFEEELYSFKNILPYMKGMKVKSLLSLFMQRLASRSLDDVRGGKVTVMGVLETRSVNFDAVIIVDFSDSNVPKKSDKDMFLNTQIREMAQLPTMSDRESLQKHYYDLLISRSQEVAISYVCSSQSSGSRFLKQLQIKEDNPHEETDYANILFKKEMRPQKEEAEIVLEYSFKNKEISATRLKTFLTCKRKYYYKYIEHIYGHEIPKDMPKEYEIGNHVHNALSNLYRKKNTYSNSQDLQRDLYKELDVACGKTELDKYLISMQKRRLKKFCEEDIKRFEQGWHVESCEEKFTCTYAGATLSGTIDRIDKNKNEIYVLDYKTGSYPLYNKNSFVDATDFQLEFYYLLAQGLGNVVGCGYYDLKESKIVQEPFLQEKLEVLQSNLKDLLSIESVNFELCEDSKHCLFCDYKIMCGRA